MATSGVIYGERRVSDRGPRLELHWSVVSQDVAKNTSRIKVVSLLTVLGTIDYQSGGKSGTTTCGTTTSYIAPSSSRTATTRTLGTTYHTITHGSDGSYNGNLSGYFNLVSLTWNGVLIKSLTASGAIDPPVILRGIDESSIVYVFGWKSQTDDKTITFNKIVDNVRVEIHWEYWSSVGDGWTTQRMITDNYTSGAFFNHGSTYNDYAHINNPNSTEIANRYTLKVYQGTTLIQEIPRIVKLKASFDPPAINLTVKCVGINQANLGSDVRGVQGVHDVDVSVTGTGKGGATISNYKIEFQGSVHTGSTLRKKITSAGTLPIKATITDSRGITNTATQNITSIEYNPPKLTNLVAARYEGTTRNPLGTDWKVTGTITSTSITSADGSVANYPSWWFEKETPTYSTSVLRGGSNLSVENSVSWTLTYRDSFSQEYKFVVTIPTGKATFVMGKDSVGVGFVPPADSKGLFVKDNLINGAVFGGVQLTSELTTIADGLKNGEVKFFMTSAAYPFGTGNEQFAFGIIARRWAQRFIIAFGLDNKIYMRNKSSDAATWTSWVAK